MVAACPFSLRKILSTSTFQHERLWLREKIRFTFACETSLESRERILCRRSGAGARGYESLPSPGHKTPSRLKLKASRALIMNLLSSILKRFEMSMAQNFEREIEPSY